MDNDCLRMVGAVSLAASLFLGCSGSKLTGTTDGGDDASSLSAFAGSWDGYVEAYSFSPDGSDRVRLTVDSKSLGTALQIGDGAPLAAPTDPDVGYPAEIVDNTGLYEGFLYPAHAPAITANRIQLGFDTSEVYAAWCALQTPYIVNEIPLPDGGTRGFYGCVPNWETGPNNSPDGGPDAGPGCALTPPDGGAILPVDCEKLTLCSPGSSVCSCTASSCAGRDVPAGTPLNQSPADLDVTADSTGTILTGTLATPNGTRLNVHFTKQ